MLRIPEKRLVGKSFSLKAGSYDRHARAQRLAAQKLGQLVPRPSGPQRWLDLGSGTGVVAEVIARLDMPPSMVCVDYAWNSNLRLKTKGIPGATVVAADIEDLPFDSPCFDGVVCASTTQWLPDLGPLLSGVRRVLAPRGFFGFAVVLRESLGELAALQTGYGLSPPVRYETENDFLATLSEAGLRATDIAHVDEQITCSTPWELLRSVSLTGATAIEGPRLSRDQLKRFCDDLGSLCRDGDKYSMRFQFLCGISRRSDS